MPGCLGRKPHKKAGSGPLDASPAPCSLVSANFSSLSISKLAAAKDHRHVDRSRAPAPRLGQPVVPVPLLRPRHMPGGHLQVHQHAWLLSGLLGCQPDIRRDHLMPDNSVVVHFFHLWRLLCNQQLVPTRHRVQDRRLDACERGRNYMVSSPPQNLHVPSKNPEPGLTRPIATQPRFGQPLLHPDHLPLVPGPQCRLNQLASHTLRHRQLQPDHRLPRDRPHQGSRRHPDPYRRRRYRHHRALGNLAAWR